MLPFDVEYFVLLFTVSEHNDCVTLAIGFVGVKLGPSHSGKNAG